MQTNSKVSWQLRALLPFLLITNAALIAAAHACKGAATQVDGKAPLGTLKAHVASDDNLLSAVQRLWGAKAYWMVFVVALLSGALPYLKIMGTFVVVGLVDVGQLGTATASTAFWILEVIGKYSFADVFLICLNCLIFDVSTGGTYRVMLFGSLEISLWVQLKFGAVALIIAITFSAFLTHWAAYEISCETPSEAVTGEEEAPLVETRNDSNIGSGQAELRWQRNPSSLSLYLPTRATCFNLTFSLLMCLTTIAGMVMLVICARYPMMNVTRGGFLGKLIRPPGDRTLEMGIFSITRGLQQLARVHGQEESRFFAVMFLLLTFVVPMLELMALFATSCALSISGLWYRRCRLAADWCHSFGCTEVLLIVMVVCVYELHTVVEFNLGTECKPFQSLMNNRPILTVAGLGFAADKTCFEPVSKLQAGFWFALVAVLLRTATWRMIGMYGSMEKNRGWNTL